MTKSEERDLFLNNLAKWYKQNPNLVISQKNVYKDLVRFNVENDKQEIIKNENLVSVQANLRNFFPKNSRIAPPSDNRKESEFLIIFNKEGKSDVEYHQLICNSVKLYVAIEPEKLCQVAEKVIRYMLDEHIIMHCKIANIMRNDAFVIRIYPRENAKKVIEFINSLDYKPKIKPNPFILSVSDKVSMAVDGTLSYNEQLCSLIAKYLQLRRNTNRLDKVSQSDFCNFVKKVIQKIKERNFSFYEQAEELDDDGNIETFLMICTQIIENINGTLTEERLFSQNNTYYNEMAYGSDDVSKLLYVMNTLSGYYSISDVHDIILKYIETGNINLFMECNEDDKIVRIVKENFNAQKMKEIISMLGWNALLKASSDTEKRYGDNQLFRAISDLLSSGSLGSFTNNNNSRSYLGFVIPHELLIEVIKEKLSINGYDMTVENVMELIILILSKKKEMVKGSKGF